MFDSGSIVFSIRAAGALVFQKDISDAEKATEKLAKSSETASSKTEQLGGKQESAAQKAKQLAQAQADAEKATRDYSDAQDAVGKVLVTAGAAIVATTGLTVKAAIDWETAWAGVTKTVEGTPEMLADVESGLRGLTSVLPASHAEIAAVAEAAGQLGVKTEDVVGFTRTMIDLGETTNLSSDQAATSLAQLMNIMGTAGEDVDRLGSTIVALGNDGASTEAEIVAMAQRIAGSGKLVGATEGEVLALSNALASMGVTAELGGGVASRILQDLYSAVQTGGDRLAAFADVAGVSAQDFATAFKNDPVRAMGDFATGLNGVEASGGNVVQTLSDLGFKSTEEQRILLQLKSAGDLLTDSLELQNTAWQENSALQTEAAKRYETVESQLGIMRNRINDAAIDLGSVFLPIIADGAEVVGDFADTIASLPAPVQEFIAGGTLAAGAVALFGGTALIAVPKIVTLIGQIRLLATTSTGMTAALGKGAAFLTGPWGIAILAAVTALTVLQAKVDETKASSEEFQNLIRNAKSPAELFAATESDFALLSSLDQAIASADVFQQKLDLIANNDFLRGLDGAASNLKYSLADIGKQLSDTAASDLPAAQRAFRMLGEEYDLNTEQLGWLLNAMPEYKAALVDVATQQGINVTSTDEAANATKLLEIAQGDAEEQSKSSAEAYMDEADAVKTLVDELISLLDQINALNALNQDAIGANAAYLEALSGISVEVQRQKDAYQQAHDTLDGFTLSLDENTASGSANASSLADVAAAAQEAASKQFELDSQTMSAKDATDKYAATLAAQRQAFIDSAVQAGYNADQVKALADRVFQLPDAKTLTIVAETAQANSRLSNLWNDLNNLVGKTWNIPVATTVVGQGTVLKPPGQATGGPVIGPGTGTSDSVLRRLSNGEHVITAAEVQAAGGHAAVQQWRQSLLAGGDQVAHASVIPSPRIASAPALSIDRVAAGGPGSVTYIDRVDVALPAADPEIAAMLFADKLRDGFASSPGR